MTAQIIDFNTHLGRPRTIKVSALRVDLGARQNPARFSCALPINGAGRAGRRGDEDMDDKEIERVVNGAATSISIELDRMFDSLPPDVDVTKVAFELMLQLGAISNHPKVTTLAGKVLSARRALEKTGHQF
jgi:hypothetical protein